MLQLPFFAALRAPSRTKGVAVAVAVLRAPPRPLRIKERCSSWSFVALRGSKGVAVAVALLRGPPRIKGRCSSWSFVALRGSKGVAVAVLRGPSRPFADKRCCRCSCRSPRPLRIKERCSSWPFVDQKVLPLPFFAALRAPSRIKGVAVAVLRGPSWIKRCCSCRSPRPSVDQPVLYPRKSQRSQTSTSQSRLFHPLPYIIPQRNRNRFH